MFYVGSPSSGVACFELSRYYKVVGYDYEHEDVYDEDFSIDFITEDEFDFYNHDIKTFDKYSVVQSDKNGFSY